MRRALGSWLSGPRVALADAEEARQAVGPRGERLGLPTSGPGAVAGVGRRLGAVTLDWLLSVALARGFIGGSAWAPLAVFAVENIVLLATLGTTVGQRVLGIRVTDLHARVPRPLPVLARTVLLCLAIPALVWDRDGRGLHDRAGGTVVVRSR